MDLKPFLPMLLLALLATLPIFLIPIAPLTDWPVHLADSRMAFLVLTGQPHNAFYSVRFDALGYSLVHGLLIALQYVMSLQLAGQLVLVLLILISPFCWWYFFHLLDPSKEKFWAIGLLMNFTTFFYWGNINYLFALNFGLVFLASGICLFRRRSASLAAFFLAGVLTYLSHGYVFLMAAGVLGLVWAYEAIYQGRSIRFRPTLVLLALILAVGMNLIGPTLSSASLFKDRSMYAQMQSCAISALDQVQSSYNPAAVNSRLALGTLLELLRDKLLNPDQFLYSIFPYVHLRVMAFFALSAFICVLVIRWAMNGQPAKKAMASLIPKISIASSLYLAIALLFLLHYVLAPSDVLNTFPIGLDIRSLPFVLAFFVLALRFPHESQIATFVLALVAASILFQAYVFNSHLSAQEQVLGHLQQAAQGISSNATVFVVPADWTNLRPFQLYPVFENPHYHAMLSVYAPTLYVSGLFLDEDHYLLRSAFPLHDEIIFLPSVSARAPGLEACYSRVPPAYGWILDENISVRRNPAAPVS